MPGLLCRGEPCKVFPNPSPELRPISEDEDEEEEEQQQQEDDYGGGQSPLAYAKVRPRI